MGVLTVVLYALVVVTGLLLIGLILIQPSKGGGMGSAFGGVGESVLGAHAGSHLTKATVWLTSLFFIVSLVLATLIGHGYRGKSEMSSLREQAVKAVNTQEPQSVAVPEKAEESAGAAEKSVAK